MNGLKELLSKEQIRLEQIIKGTKERLSSAPEGALRLSKSHEYLQYYHCTEEKKSGSYIAKENMELVKKLAQKSYDEKVLRQTEKIMADYFFRNGIEYKYECPLYLKGMGLVYPDFTFLSPKTGEEIYWEHNGRADDPAYARKMVRKI